MDRIIDRGEQVRTDPNPPTVTNRGQLVVALLLLACLLFAPVAGQVLR